MTTIRPRRSVLYMPGSNARALEKARTLAADVADMDEVIADALGGKSENPQVKQLLTDIQSYKNATPGQTGANSHKAGRPSVVVTA